MKKILILLMMVFLPLAIFSQVPEPPTDPGGFIEWFKIALGTWAGGLAAILLLTEKVKRILVLKGKWAVLLSWFIALPISFIAAYFNIGIFDGIVWYETLIYAASFSVSTNIGYLMPVVKEGVRLLIDRIDVEKLAKKNNE
jgi:hypothetical protein